MLNFVKPRFICRPRCSPYADFHFSYSTDWGWVISSSRDEVEPVVLDALLETPLDDESDIELDVKATFRP